MTSGVDPSIIHLDDTHPICDVDINRMILKRLTGLTYKIGGLVQIKT